jgi:hypothetical protein
MPQHALLSNGARLNIPDGTPPEEIRARVNTANALIQSHAMSFIGGGKAIWDAANAVAGSAGRIAGAGVDLDPYIGAADYGIGGLNALKAVASKYAPALKGYPDLPTASGLVTSAIGAPSFSPDASPVQRYGEAAVTGALNPGSAIRSALQMVGATGGGDVGGAIASYYGGPFWEKLGRWLGTGAGAAATTKVTDPQALAGPQAPDVGQAAANTGITPTFGSVAGPVGRGMEQGLRAFPLVNIPIVSAQTRLEEGVRQANLDAAAAVNRGPLAPEINADAIGTHLINAARTRSAAIKADAGQQFENLYNQLPAGNSTLVDATPVLDAIRAQANSPNVSGQQKADLMDRYNYLQSMTYGQPGYNGPRFQGVTPVNAIPIGQIARFRSELGDDMNTMRGIDATAQGPARDAVTGAMQNTFNRAGLGPQFQAVNDNYSRNIGPGTPTDTLDTIGGKPITGKPGLYNGGMNEKGAYNYLANSVQSPSNLEPLVDPSNPDWRAASSGFIATLGAKNGPFSAKDYGGQVGDGKQPGGISDDVLEQLTRGQPDQAQKIRDAATVGVNASTPPSKGGVGSVASAIGTEWLMDKLGDFVGHGPAAMTIPLAMMAGMYGAQSRPFTSAMSTGGSTPIVDALYTIAPAAYDLNNPDDPRNQPPPGAGPPSPLDALRQQQ